MIINRCLRLLSIVSFIFIGVNCSNDGVKHKELTDGYTLKVRVQDDTTKWSHNNVFIAFEDGFQNDDVQVIGLKKDYDSIILFDSVITTDLSLSLAEGIMVDRYSDYLIKLRQTHFTISLVDTISAIYIDRHNKDIEVLLTNKSRFYQ